MVMRSARAATVTQAPVVGRPAAPRSATGPGRLAPTGTSGAAAARRTGWRIVLARHFGSAGSRNGYDAVLGHRSDAWFFGGTNLGGSGSLPVIEHRVDGTWHRAKLPGGLHSWIAAASAASPKNIWAVSHFGGYVLNWNALGWQKVPAGGWARGTLFTGIDAVTRKDVWVFGSGGGKQPGAGTWHLTVQAGVPTWTRAGGIAGDIYQAGDLSPSSIWAIGGIKGNQNAVLYYNGTSWRHVTARALVGMRLTFVLAEAANSVWLAGSAKQHGRLRPKLAHWNGKRWVRIAVPDGPAPTWIAADGHGGIWAIANSGRGPSSLLRRASSGKWVRVRISSIPANQVNALARVPGTTSLWGGGVSRAKSGSNATVYAFGSPG
jgi:hypothetical protein